MRTAGDSKLRLHASRFMSWSLPIARMAVARSSCRFCGVAGRCVDQFAAICGTATNKPLTGRIRPATANLLDLATIATGHDQFPFAADAFTARPMPSQAPDGHIRNSAVICITLVFPGPSYSFSRDLRPWGCKAGPRQRSITRRAGRRAFQRHSSEAREFMSFQFFAGAAYRALTARKDGPSLYEVCDPLLRKRAAATRISPNSIDRARQSGAAAAAAAGRAARIERRRPPRRCARRWARARRRRSGLGGDRPPVAACSTPSAEPSRSRPVRPRARARRHWRDRQRDPDLRRASAAVVRARTDSSRPMPPST